jgi:hypothetical protein
MAAPVDENETTRMAVLAEDSVSEEVEDMAEESEGMEVRKARSGLTAQYSHLTDSKHLLDLRCSSEHDS